MVATDEASKQAQAVPESKRTSMTLLQDLGCRLSEIEEFQMLLVKFMETRCGRDKLPEFREIFLEMLEKNIRSRR